MTKVYYDKDIELTTLMRKTIAMIGYGNQGRAQALNARDSGCKIIIGNQKDDYWKMAHDDGFEVLPIDEAAKLGDIIVMLVPDEAQPEVYKVNIEKNLKDKKCLMFGSGFNIHYGFIKPPEFIDVVLVAPVCPGFMVRDTYCQGAGPFTLMAVHQDHSGKSKEISLAYAKAIGGTRWGVVETSFAEEVETDLFTEVAGQGIIPHLLLAAYEVMVEAGYSPEAAYSQTIYEFKFMGDAIYKFGIADSVSRWSRTAQYLVLRYASTFIDEKLKQSMKEYLKRVQNGEFARDWAIEYQAGEPIMQRMLENLKKNPVRKVEKLFLPK
ncbi:ketol-acid reductoisomerase [[Eubacterium] cellulosolvens]